MYGSVTEKKRKKKRAERSTLREGLSVCLYLFDWRHRYHSWINKRSEAYSIRFKSIETNWKWQARKGGDNSCITSTWSYQWSEATRWCLYYEGHRNPFQIKNKRKGNARRSLTSTSFFTLIFQFTSHKHTPGEFNHTLAKIQLCVMTSSSMNWAVQPFAYFLFLTS